jgi:hypothetical protein
MDQFIMSLSPSQAYLRIRELSRKSDFEGLNEDEVYELQALKDVYHDSLSDYEDEFGF